MTTRAVRWRVDTWRGRKERRCGKRRDGKTHVEKEREKE